MNIITRRQAWRVERIDTVPMTRQEYNFAVATLAALIRQWIHKRETMTQGNENVSQEQDVNQKQGGKNGTIDPRAPNQESRDNHTR
jgi:hypothetical protein